MTPEQLAPFYALQPQPMGQRGQSALAPRSGPLGSMLSSAGQGAGLTMAPAAASPVVAKIASILARG